ncbi:MAG: OsmC family protein [Dehalococcoidia bacterium]|nr:OsmC family protein [Dehalococcoidia bacterium]
MAKKNNVDVDALQKTVEAMQADPSKGKRTNKVEGVWNLAEGKPQFSAELSFEGGKLVLEADQPTFLGGGGTRPGPMHYAIFGLASCFTATFATMATTLGLSLDEVRTTAEFHVNFAKVFGVADTPIVEEVRVTLAVKSDASRERIEEAMRLAEERCPASYCVTQPIRLTAKLAN